jgi:hypothetical protein
MDDESSVSNETAPGAPATDAGPAPRPLDWDVNVEGREIVAMSASEIVLKLRTGELSGQTLAWREGMEEWTALDALPVFALAAPVSSRPAASESRPKASEDVTVKRSPQITEVGLQPPGPGPVIETAAALESYDPEGATRVRSLPDVPLEEATVIVRDAETLPPPPDPEPEAGAVSARGDDLAEALAVYERPVATLAFPEHDAPTDEETVVSDPPDPSSEPPAPAPRPPSAEEPPVPPLPKLPSRALVSTAAATFLPPAHPPARSPSGAPRLSSLGPATGARPSSPSSPSITKKPLVPSAPAGAPQPAPLVEALLSLTDKHDPPPEMTTPPAAPSSAPPAKVSSTPPTPPSAKATAKAPSAPPIRVKPETPVVTVEAEKRSEARVPRMQRQHTPAETPLARAASERPPVAETPTPVAAAAATPAPEVAAPPTPAMLLPADSEPLNVTPPPPPLPERGPVNLAGIPANTTPTIILREDRDADTMITNLRAARSVPFRTAVAGGAVSTLVGSLITGLVVSSMQPDPPKAAPPPAPVATVVAAPVPPPAPEPPKPAVEEPPAPKASASELTIPSVSARELATEKKPKKSAPAWTPPKPKPKLADPEVALPEDPSAAATAPAEKKPSPDSDSSDSAADKNKAAWETSPSPGF